MNTEVKLEQQILDLEQKLQLVRNVLSILITWLPRELGVEGQKQLLELFDNEASTTTKAGRA